MYVFKIIFEISFFFCPKVEWALFPPAPPPSYYVAFPTSQALVLAQYPMGKKEIKNHGEILFHPPPVQLQD